MEYHIFYQLLNQQDKRLLKRNDTELRSLIDVEILLMAEKQIRSRICHTIQRYAKANNKCMKNYDKTAKSSYLMYLDANILQGQAMSHKLNANNF